jgi:hypothetical protein
MLFNLKSCLHYPEARRGRTLRNRRALRRTELQRHRYHRVARVHICAMRRGNVVHVLVHVLQNPARRHVEGLVAKVDLVGDGAASIGAGHFIAAQEGDRRRIRVRSSSADKNFVIPERRFN